MVCNLFLEAHVIHRIDKKNYPVNPKKVHPMMTTVVLGSGEMGTKVLTLEKIVIRIEWMSHPQR